MFKENQKFVIKKCVADGVAPVGALKSGKRIWWCTEYDGKDELESIYPESLDVGDLVLCEVHE